MGSLLISTAYRLLLGVILRFCLVNAKSAQTRFTMSQRSISKHVAVLLAMLVDFEVLQQSERYQGALFFDWQRGCCAGKIGSRDLAADSLRMASTFTGRS